MALAASDDKLWDFLQQARYHQLATLTNIKPAFDMLRDVDDGFVRLLEKIDKPPNHRSTNCLLYFFTAHMLPIEQHVVPAWLVNHQKPLFCCVPASNIRDMRS